MGHYWSEMRGEPTELEIKQEEARELVKKLRSLPSSRFSVDELAILLRTDWHQYQDSYSKNTCEIIFKLAEREGIAGVVQR